MKENNMKPRHNRSDLQGSEKRSLIQPRPTPCTSQTTGPKPFIGKVFYLDLASNRVAETLENDIKDLGGTVEKFFSKEIKYLVSNKREAKYVQCLRQDSPIPSPESGPSSPQPCSNPHQPQSHGDSTKSTSQPQKDAVATSRGKSLVKRVVKEQERIHLNTILSNALDWGVKILYLDDVIAYVQKKKKTFDSQHHPSTVKTNIKAESTKRVFQKSKGGRITKPFVKVEDSSRHYRPFYISLKNIPEFNLTTFPPCTPFCAEDKGAPGNKPDDHRGGGESATDERPNERKKKKQGGYCECCLVKYDNIAAHLQSDQHKAFAKSDEYVVVDKLVAAMCSNFTHIRSKLKRRRCSVPVLVASGPFADKPRHVDVVDSAVNVERLQFARKHERRTEEERNSELDSKSSCPSSLVINRMNKRRKRQKPQPLCHQKQQAEGEQDPHPKGELAPPTGDSVAAHPALSEVQLPDHSVLKSQEPREPASVIELSEMSPESLAETNQKVTTLKSSLCGTAHSGSQAYKQKTDNFVFQTYNSSEDFVPVERIQRKIKVYKRKKRKVATPVASEHEELRDSEKDRFMRLWELFQTSDDMDLEFYGFE